MDYLREKKPIPLLVSVLFESSLFFSVSSGLLAWLGESFLLPGSGVSNVAGVLSV
jgi:hypothetical protein